MNIEQVLESNAWKVRVHQRLYLHSYGFIQCSNCWGYRGFDPPLLELTPTSPYVHHLAPTSKHPNHTNFWVGAHLTSHQRTMNCAQWTSFIWHNSSNGCTQVFVEILLNSRCCCCCCCRRRPWLCCCCSAAAAPAAVAPAAVAPAAVALLLLPLLLLPCCCCPAAAAAAATAAPAAAAALFVSAVHLWRRACVCGVRDGTSRHRIADRCLFLRPLQDISSGRRSSTEDRLAGEDRWGKGRAWSYLQFQQLGSRGTSCDQYRDSYRSRNNTNRGSSRCNKRQQRQQQCQRQQYKMQHQGQQLQQDQHKSDNKSNSIAAIARKAQNENDRLSSNGSAWFNTSLYEERGKFSRIHDVTIDYTS